MKKIAFIFLLAVLFSCQTIPSADSPGLSLGKNPKLPEPSSSIIPTVSIAKASQWPEGVMPKVIDSFMISLYSKELTSKDILFGQPPKTNRFIKMVLI